MGGVNKIYLVQGVDGMPLCFAYDKELFKRTSVEFRLYCVENRLRVVECDDSYFSTYFLTSRQILPFGEDSAILYESLMDLRVVVRAIVRNLFNEMIKTAVCCNDPIRFTPLSSTWDKTLLGIVKNINAVPLSTWMMCPTDDIIDIDVFGNDMEVVDKLWDLFITRQKKR